MKKIIVIAESKGLGKMFYNFFVLIGWSTHLLRRKEEALKKYDALILIMKSRNQIVRDLRKVKLEFKRVRIICAMTHHKSSLRDYLQGEGVSHFVTRKDDFFSEALKKRVKE